MAPLAVPSDINCAAEFPGLGEKFPKKYERNCYKIFTNTALKLRDDLRASFEARGGIFEVQPLQGSQKFPGTNLSANSYNYYGEK